MTNPQQSPRYSPGRLGGRLGLGVVALGFVAIGLGYNGAAGTIALAAQLPYLVSGGLIGVSLVILGGALLIVQAGREDRQRLETLLLQLVEAGGLTGGLGGTAGAPALVPSDVEGLFAAGSASFHRPDCRLVEGRDDVNYLTGAEATATGLKACRVCQPLGAPLPEQATRTAR